MGRVGFDIPDDVLQIILLFYFTEKATEEPIILPLLFIGHREHPSDTHPLVNQYLLDYGSIPMQDESNMGYILKPKRYCKRLYGAEQLYDLQIWDCGFPNSFRIFTGFQKSMVSRIEAVILTFDQEDVNALSGLERYIENIRNVVPPERRDRIFMLLVGMGSDVMDHYPDSVMTAFCTKYEIQKSFRIYQDADRREITKPFVYAMSEMVRRREQLNLSSFDSVEMESTERKRSSNQVNMLYALGAVVVAAVIYSLCVESWTNGGIVLEYINLLCINFATIGIMKCRYSLRSRIVPTRI